MWSLNASDIEWRWIEQRSVDGVLQKSVKWAQQDEKAIFFGENEKREARRGNYEGGSAPFRFSNQLQRVLIHYFADPHQNAVSAEKAAGIKYAGTLTPSNTLSTLNTLTAPTQPHASPRHHKPRLALYSSPPRIQRPKLGMIVWLRHFSTLHENDTGFL